MADDMIARIDSWAGARDIKVRAEAIRRLIEAGLGN